MGITLQTGGTVIESQSFDLVILGGGPGGYAAALYGASAGLNIAMVEQKRVGGTCLHQGCIPAKALLQTADVLRTVSSAAEFGVVGDKSPTLNLGTVQTRKHAVIDRLTKGLEGLLRRRSVTVYNGRGKLASPTSIELDDGTVINGTNVILASGSTPRSIPGFNFDGQRILSSDHLLELGQIPDRAVIIGGGAIGCEFASFLIDAGAEVTLLEALPSILPGVDPDVSKVVARALAKRGVKVETGVKVTGQRPAVGGVSIQYETSKGGQTLDADVCVVSVGRQPRSEGIGYTENGVSLDSRGFVEVDGRMRTSVPGIYAVGDLTATPQLAHVAFAEAIVAIKDILDEEPTPVDYGKVPWGIYCHPEVGFCGMTEDAAKEAGYDVIVSKHQFAGNGRAMIMGETDGMVKIIAEKGGALLGIHVVGPYATELVTEGYLAVNWEATPADMGALIHAHPTLGELIGETALSLTGRSLHG